MSSNDCVNYHGNTHYHGKMHYHGHTHYHGNTHYNWNMHYHINMPEGRKQTISKLKPTSILLTKLNGEMCNIFSSRGRKIHAAAECQRDWRNGEASSKYDARHWILRRTWWTPICTTFILILKYLTLIFRLHKSNEVGRWSQWPFHNTCKKNCVNFFVEEVY